MWALSLLFLILWFFFINEDLKITKDCLSLLNNKFLEKTEKTVQNTQESRKFLAYNLPRESTKASKGSTGCGQVSWSVEIADSCDSLYAKAKMKRGGLTCEWQCPKGPSRAVFSTESDSVVFYYSVVNLLCIVIHYWKYGKSVQNVVIHYILTSESLRVVNSLLQRPNFPGKSLQFCRKSDFCQISGSEIWNSEPEKWQFHTRSHSIPPLDALLSIVSLCTAGPATIPVTQLQHIPLNNMWRDPHIVQARSKGDWEHARASCKLRRSLGSFGKPTMPNFKNEKSARRGSVWDGHPADIRGSFARISRPKTLVRVVKIL